MQDKFLESIRNGFISQIEEIVSETEKTSKERNMNAIDTLTLINKNISLWILSLNGMININNELVKKVVELKKPFVSAAKKEVAEEVSKIIENESKDVRFKISSYIEELKKKGLDLDGNNDELVIESQVSIHTTTRESELLPVDIFSRRLYEDRIKDCLVESREGVLKRSWGWEKPSRVSFRLF